MIPASRPEELEEQAEALERLVVRELTSVDGLTPQQLQQLTEGAHPHGTVNGFLHADGRLQHARRCSRLWVHCYSTPPAANAVDGCSCALPNTSLTRVHPFGMGLATWCHMLYLRAAIHHRECCTQCLRVRRLVLLAACGDRWSVLRARKDGTGPPGRQAHVADALHTCTGGDAALACTVAPSHRSWCPVKAHLTGGGAGGRSDV
jgi:hypothetical protein